MWRLVVGVGRGVVRVSALVWGGRLSVGLSVVWFVGLCVVFVAGILTSYWLLV